MLLREIAERPAQTEIVEIDPVDGEYGRVKVEVGFDYVPASYSQHAPDNYTYRERHPSAFLISFIRLAERVYELTDDGHETGKFWEPGTPAEKLPGWGPDDVEQVERALDEQFGSGGNSDADDDHYDDDWKESR